METGSLWSPSGILGGVIWPERAHPQERPGSIRRCRPGGIGVRGEWPTEESQSASFAAKWPHQHHSQDSFKDPLSPGLMDALTCALWAIHGDDAPSDWKTNYLEAIIWCSAFGSCLVLNKMSWLCRSFAKPELFFSTSCLGLDQREISNLYRTEHILLSLLRSIVYAADRALYAMKAKKPGSPPSARSSYSFAEDSNTEFHENREW